MDTISVLTIVVNTLNDIKVSGEKNLNNLLAAIRALNMQIEQMKGEKAHVKGSGTEEGRADQ